MDLNDKLKGFPHVYYFNLDIKKERKIYMERQFEERNINFTRVSSSKYYCENINSNPKQWIDKMLVGSTEGASLGVTAVSITIFEVMKEWLSKNEQFFIMMEDDYDLNIIDYWHFDWEYFMSRLPYDWDCIQLGFECPDVIPFYLHPIQPEYSIGPSLMKREYVEKLLDLHCVGDKYKFDHRIANYQYIDRDSGVHDGLSFKNTSGSPDYHFNQSGKTYSIPLIAMNPYFSGASDKNNQWIPKASFQICYDAYYDWWKYDRDRFTLDEFFTYGKSTDVLMQKQIKYCDTKYFESKSIECRKRFFIDHEFK